MWKPPGRNVHRPTPESKRGIRSSKRLGPAAESVATGRGDPLVRTRGFSSTLLRRHEPRRSRVSSSRCIANYLACRRELIETKHSSGREKPFRLAAPRRQPNSARPGWARERGRASREKPPARKWGEAGVCRRRGGGGGHGRWNGRALGTIGPARAGVRHVLPRARAKGWSRAASDLC